MTISKNEVLQLREKFEIEVAKMRIELNKIESGLNWKPAFEISCKKVLQMDQMWSVLLVETGKMFPGEEIQNVIAILGIKVAAWEKLRNGWQDLYPGVTFTNGYKRTVWTLVSMYIPRLTGIATRLLL